MALLAVTVISTDRVGLVADVTGVLADLGGNLEDSSMTLLHGHFAWTLLLRTDAASGEVEQRLRGACPEGVAVTAVAEGEATATRVAARFLVSVHGSDRIGIVSQVSRVLADKGGNITELTTRLGSARPEGALYLALAEVEFSTAVTEDALRVDLEAACAPLGLEVAVHRDEPDVL